MPSLIDVCGNCNGDGLNCTFVTTVVVDGLLVGGKELKRRRQKANQSNLNLSFSLPASAAAGLVAAALAAAIAATLALRPKSQPATSNPLQDQGKSIVS